LHRAAPSKSPPKGSLATHSPEFSKIPVIIGPFESAEQRYKVDVVDMKFGFAM
jgi:hypothetical protein